MIHDAALPEGIEPSHDTVERAGVLYQAAHWTPVELEAVGQHLEQAGRGALAGLHAEDLFATWCDTVETFRDPDSEERRSLDPSLARLCGLSPAGLGAGLEAVLGGVSRQSAATLFDQSLARRSEVGGGGLVVAALAANLPGLAVQPLLPALLLGRPMLLKSPTAEPLFAPAFVRALCRRQPALRSVLAAVTWKGGDRALEAPLLDIASRVLAYGEADALADLAARAPGKVFAYGPKTSLGVVGRTVAPSSVVEGLARDIALFDQRGCLSLQAVFTDGNAEELATLVAEELHRLASVWPPGPLDPVAAAGVQQVRSEAAMRGLYCADLPLAVGTIVVETESRLIPSPGLRTVRIQPVADLARLPEALSEWSGKLQGAALAGDEAWDLETHLADLGVSRFAPPGELQTPDASWHNGGVHPLAVLTRPAGATR